MLREARMSGLGQSVKLPYKFRPNQTFISLRAAVLISLFGSKMAAA
jgi:hypothetical protein